MIHSIFSLVSSVSGSSEQFTQYFGQWLRNYLPEYHFQHLWWSNLDLRPAVGDMILPRKVPCNDKMPKNALRSWLVMIQKLKKAILALQSKLRLLKTEEELFNSFSIHRRGSLNPWTERMQFVQPTALKWVLSQPKRAITTTLAFCISMSIEQVQQLLRTADCGNAPIHNSCACPAIYIHTYIYVDLSLSLWRSLPHPLLRVWIVLVGLFIVMNYLVTS